MSIYLGTSAEGSEGGGGYVDFVSNTNTSRLYITLPRSYRSPNTNLTFANGFACAAHCHFYVSGGTPYVSTNGSINALSLSDNGVGTYTLNFLSSLPTNYRAAGGHHSANASSSGVFSHIQAYALFDQSSNFSFRTWTNQTVDPPFGSIVIYTT